MLDIHLIKKDPAFYVEKLKYRMKDAQESIEAWLRLETEKNDCLQNAEKLRHERKEKSKGIGKLIGSGAPKEDIEKIKAEVKNIGDEIKESEDKVDEILALIEEIALRVPNIPHNSAPEGFDEDSNKVLETVGKPSNFEFEVEDHTELGESLGMLDFKRAAKLSGSRFSVLYGDGALLENAITQFMLNEHINNGFIQVSLPQIVNSEVLRTSGNLPKFEEDLYKVNENQYLIPTSEPPLVAMFMDEIIPESKLPLKLCCFSQCFRKEAGSYGKDTRGLIRQHQFAKVEMVGIATPEKSEALHDEFIEAGKSILDKLELPYQVMQLSQGDMGFQSHRTIDLEVWLPSENKYREISSISNCWDFQARRGKIRVRKEDQKKPLLAHTLNGSGLAVGRTFLAIIENYQLDDKTIRVPAVLKKYLANRDTLSIDNRLNWD